MMKYLFVSSSAHDESNAQHVTGYTHELKTPQSENHAICEGSPTFVATPHLSAFPQQNVRSVMIVTAPRLVGTTLVKSVAIGRRPARFAFALNDLCLFDKSSRQGLLVIIFPSWRAIANRCQLAFTFNKQRLSTFHHDANLFFRSLRVSTHGLCIWQLRS